MKFIVLFLSVMEFAKQTFRIIDLLFQVMFVDERCIEVHCHNDSKDGDVLFLCS